MLDKSGSKERESSGNQGREKMALDEWTHFQRVCQGLRVVVVTGRPALAPSAIRQGLAQCPGELSFGKNERTPKLAGAPSLKCSRSI